MISDWPDWISPQGLQWLIVSKQNVVTQFLTADSEHLAKNYPKQRFFRLLNPYMGHHIRKCSRSKGDQSKCKCLRGHNKKTRKDMMQHQLSGFSFGPKWIILKRGVMTVVEFIWNDSSFIKEPQIHHYPFLYMQYCMQYEQSSKK